MATVLESARPSGPTPDKSDSKPEDGLASAGLGSMPADSPAGAEEIVSPDWMEETLRDLPVGMLYPDIAAEAVSILRDRWYKRFPRTVWQKLMKKTQGPVPRILKELNETAPVIARTREFVEQNFASSPSSAKGVAFQDERFTIVDLGCGLGFLGMFLAEMLPSNKVKDIWLVDKMWPQYGQVHTETDGLHMTREHIDLAGYGVPVKTLKIDLKKGRDLADLVHFIFANGTKADRGSGNRIGVDSGAEAGSSCTPATTLPQPAQRSHKNRVILLGVHLCGSLSLRAADLVNRNPDTIEFACIKPCCLPGKAQLRLDMRYRVGDYEFSAKQLYESKGDKDRADTSSHASASEKCCGGSCGGAQDKMAPKNSASAEKEGVASDDDEDDIADMYGGQTDWDESAGDTAAKSHGTREAKPEVKRAEIPAGSDRSEKDSQIAEPPEPPEPCDKSTRKKGCPMRSGRRNRRFKIWCDHVFHCLTDVTAFESEPSDVVCQLVSQFGGRSLGTEDPEDPLSADWQGGTPIDLRRNRGKSHEVIVVQPGYFQNRFLFVERRARFSPEQFGAWKQKANGEYRNQILYPAYQRKKEAKLAQQAAAEASGEVAP